MLLYNDTNTQSDAYEFAVNVGLQLKELAKNRGLDPRGIKIHNKKFLSSFGKNTIDAQVSWHEGPIDWAYDIDLKPSFTVCTDIKDGYTISFYNILNTTER